MDECLIGCAIGEGTYHVGIDGAEEFIPFLGKPPDVIPKLSPISLGAPLEVSRAPGMLEGALEVLGKGLFEVDLVVDGVGWQVL